MTIPIWAATLPFTLRTSEQSGDEGSGTDFEDELLSELDSGVKVAVDRWSTGRFGDLDEAHDDE